MKSSEMSKAYNPAEHESAMYQLWEDAQAFAPHGDDSKEPFCIIMPPPNANGNLHTGHGMYVVEDIMTRYARMTGRPTLWLPGTDHAGIETQVVFERELESQGKSRFDYTREEFYDMVMDFTLKNQHNILNGFKSLGFSADWSKLKFTLDKDIIAIVCDTFRQMHDDGLIYRGNRIVNWCPRCHAGFADIELKYQERVDPLYYIKYGPFVLATVRPETKFGDTAIAVHPKDERYQKYIDNEIEAEDVLGPVKLRVIADNYVDPEFGTGVVKVTPAHDPNDWEMGLRHGLEVKQVIGTDGMLTDIAGKYAGMSAVEARAQVAADLEAKGLIDHVDMNYTHSVAVHDRCGTVIEPLVIEQWWVAVEQLKKPAIDAVRDGKIKFYPKRFEKMYLDWLENLRDWNISRQIAWGIRIPVYYNATGDTTKPEYIITTDEKEAEQLYGKGGYEAETDTFDTWFSSSQWPFATLMATGDFDQFYPTSVMATARDILYLWVARMVMLGLYRTGKVPFEEVYLWGMVNDKHGKKMSKSKGNVIDPLQFTQAFGTDALRLALTIGITPGIGGSISEEKVKGYRNFCNKLWNVARYVIGTVSDKSLSPVAESQLLSPADHWFAVRINQVITQLESDMPQYRYSEAGQAIYALLWDTFADQYLEASKKQLNPDLLVYGLGTILKLLHPFAPFVTETIWQQLYDGKSLLINEQWPNVLLQPDVEMAKAFDLEIIDILALKQRDAQATARAKLQKELKAKQNLLSITQAKLNNQAFVSNAPESVVKREEQALQDTQVAIKELEGSLEELNAS